MKKEDLRTGMIVEVRGGDKYLVMKDYVYGYDSIKNILLNLKGGWMNLNDYCEDLTFPSDSYFDIVNTFTIDNLYKLKIDISKVEILPLEDETKEMTLEEVEKELGYKIKIVDNK